eukprot:TRINITY_DN12823_c0_g1_i3.p1 TRINITY_DN12823_c0_g1~~TRINITY_DN12823_c0_g1_i3.p1  ORF type:complete len:364 (-),score=47.91 TRINITY_DN12823_c0_g1_i3:226-1317(-)
MSHFHRKRDSHQISEDQDGDSSENKKVVAEHYNRRRDVAGGRRFNLDKRNSSAIFHLKNFNNWTKSVLINLCSKPDAVVLDLCCGKAGDMLKYCMNRANFVVAADIAYNSIVDAINRYNELRGHRPGYQFIAADCFEARLSSVIAPEIHFDLVSCQFAWHYAFESEARLHMALRNVSEKLKPGGYFVGTMPDSNILVKKFRESPDGTFGNSRYRVRFEAKPRQLAQVMNGDENQDDESSAPQFPKASPFGLKYWFQLEDAIDDCPEFLVHFPTFERVAAEYGLECRSKENFHEFFYQHCTNTDNQDLLFRMKVLDRDNSIPQPDWEVAHLYRVFIFQKKGTWEPSPPIRYSSRRFHESDIIQL